MAVAYLGQQTLEKMTMLFPSDPILQARPPGPHRTTPIIEALLRPMSRVSRLPNPVLVIVIRWRPIPFMLLTLLPVPPIHRILLMN